MLGNKISNCIRENYKSHLYLKSLSLKTDFSRYSRFFKEWHPRYFDINRRTQFQRDKRDYKKLRFNTQDPLHFDYNLTQINGGIPRVIYIYFKINKVIGSYKSNNKSRYILFYI
jgi:hypothetical protein